MLVVVVVHDCGRDICHLIDLDISGNETEYPNCGIQMFMGPVSIETH